MIEITRSPRADTRTCDFTKVTLNDFEEDIFKHKNDVVKGMAYLSNLLNTAGKLHDYTKVKYMDEFYADFKTGFANKDWYNKHMEIERHHLDYEEYVPDDVDLLDVLEMIVDGVMAGLARSGEYRQAEVSDDLLRKAFYNTINLMLKNVRVVDK